MIPLSTLPSIHRIHPLWRQLRSLSRERERERERETERRWTMASLMTMIMTIHNGSSACEHLHVNICVCARASFTSGVCLSTLPYEYIRYELYTTNE
mmetsp:Transcript_4740/g.12433  ORF Transcript_4740/g.12433 Transcript_4740/m.12433 type:complete len:97 (+) Transcript_4740:950-1240(+)